MGVWSSIVGWKTLLRLDVFGVIVPGVFLAIGLAMLGAEWFPYGLLIAQISFTVAFFLSAIKAVSHAIESEDTLISRTLFVCITSTGLLGAWFLVVRSIQRHKADPTAFSPLLNFLARAWVAHLLWMCLGVLVLLVANSLLIATREMLEKRLPKQTAEKGFLNFKLQAEEAITDASPALAAITESILAVTAEMDRQAARVRRAYSSSTQEQIKVTAKAARNLDKHSRRLDGKCSRLEQIGSSLEEGLHGWYTWLTKQEASKATLAELEPSLVQFCESMTFGIKATDEYMATLKDMKGVSQDLNEAVDRHIATVARIRNANNGILNACLDAIQIANNPSSLAANV